MMSCRVMGANPSVWYCRIEWTFSDYDGPIRLAEDNDVELLARDAGAGFNHCQRQRLSGSPTLSVVCSAADNATVGEDRFRAARIGIDYANHLECDKAILEALLLPGNQRVALHEVAFIEMNEPRETGRARRIRLRARAR